MKTNPYEGYEAFSDGSVFSHKTGRFLSQKTRKNGYKEVALRVNGRYKSVLVHRMVYETYLGPIKHVINHIDGDKTNNRLENLEDITHSENTKHAWDTGLLRTKEVVFLYDGWETIHASSQVEMMKLTGLTQQEVSQVATGARKSAKGYTLFNEVK